MIIFMTKSISDPQRVPVKPFSWVMLTSSRNKLLGFTEKFAEKFARDLVTVAVQRRSSVAPSCPAPCSAERSKFCRFGWKRDDEIKRLQPSCFWNDVFMANSFRALVGAQVLFNWVSHGWSRKNTRKQTQLCIYRMNEGNATVEPLDATIKLWPFLA